MDKAETLLFIRFPPSIVRLRLLQKYGKNKILKTSVCAYL